jgi:hypothetical protein
VVKILVYFNLFKKNCIEMTTFSALEKYNIKKKKNRTEKENRTEKK